jgi:predicted DNA-binding transcriptional regulator AlpA
MTDSDLIFIEEVLQIVRLSRPTIQRLRHRKMFPEPILLGLRRTAWRKSDIEAWLENRPRADVSREMA